MNSFFAGLIGVTLFSAAASSGAEPAKDPGTPPHPTVYPTREDIRLAQTNLARFEWARQTAELIQRDANAWLSTPSSAASLNCSARPSTARVTRPGSVMRGRTRHESPRASGPLIRVTMARSNAFMPAPQSPSVITVHPCAWMIQKNWSGQPLLPAASGALRQPSVRSGELL